jgi:hypothetical protein
MDLGLKLIFLVGCDLVVLISTTSQLDLEIDLSLLELARVCVQSSCEILEEGYNVVGHFTHFVVEVFLVAYSIHYEGLALLLSPFGVWLGFALHDQIKSDAFLELSIVLDDKIFQVVKGNIDIFIRVFHIVCNLLHEVVKDNGALFAVGAKFVRNLLDKQFVQVFWMRLTHLGNHSKSDIVKSLLLILHLSEEVYSGFWVHEPLGVHLVHKHLDGMVLLQLVELDNRCLPGLVKDVELGFLGLHDIGVELLTINVLLLVLFFFVLDLLFH